MKFFPIACLSVSLMTFTAVAHASEFSYRGILHAYMKLDQNYDYDAAVDAYMQAFRPNVWQKYRNDEFEMDSKREDTIKIMKSEADKADLTMTINTTFGFGDYDFEANKYGMRPITKTTYYTASVCCYNGLPNQIKVFFDNPEIVDGLPMEKEAARTFLNARKRSGYVDRNVEATINATAVEARSDNSLLAHIDSVEIYDKYGKKKLLHSVKDEPAM